LTNPVSSSISATASEDLIDLRYIPEDVDTLLLATSIRLLKLNSTDFSLLSGFKLENAGFTSGTFFYHREYGLYFTGVGAGDHLFL